MSRELRARGRDPLRRQLPELSDKEFRQMTERVDQVTPQYRRVARRPQPAPGQQPRSADQPGRSAEPARTKPVRRSVDLSPAYHTRLTQWCRDTAEELGTTRVTGQDVIRALVARLLVDQNLARRIRADLSINM